MIQITEKKEDYFYLIVMYKLDTKNKMEQFCVKFGRTKNIFKRLKEYKTHCLYPHKLWTLLQCEDKKTTLELEKFLMNIDPNKNQLENGGKEFILNSDVSEIERKVFEWMEKNKRPFKKFEKEPTKNLYEDKEFFQFFEKEEPKKEEKEKDYQKSMKDLEINSIDKNYSSLSSKPPSLSGFYFCWVFDFLFKVGITEDFSKRIERYKTYNAESVKWQFYPMSIEKAAYLESIFITNIREEDLFLTRYGFSVEMTLSSSFKDFKDFVEERMITQKAENRNDLPNIDCLKDHHPLNKIDLHERCFECFKPKENQKSNHCNSCISILSVKCSNCSNKRNVSPLLFQQNFKRCNSCLWGCEKYREKREKDGQCRSCYRRKEVEPEEFKKGNKICSHCLGREKIIEDKKRDKRYKQGLCIKSDCMNNRREHPEKFKKDTKKCLDCCERTNKFKDYRKFLGKCRNCKFGREKNPEKFKNEQMINCIECLKKEAERRRIMIEINPYKCQFKVSCTNDKISNPNKFRKNNKSCNDCLDEANQKKKENCMKKEKCPTCSNNKKENPEMFNEKSKTCTICSAKQKERYRKCIKDGKCTKCTNNKKDNPEKFIGEKINCRDCLNKLKQQNQKTTTTKPKRTTTTNSKTKPKHETTTTTKPTTPNPKTRKNSKTTTTTKPTTKPTTTPKPKTKKKPKTTTTKPTTPKPTTTTTTTTKPTKKRKMKSENEKKVEVNKKTKTETN